VVYFFGYFIKHSSYVVCSGIRGPGTLLEVGKFSQLEDSFGGWKDDKPLLD